MKKRQKKRQKKAKGDVFGGNIKNCLSDKKTKRRTRSSMCPKDVEKKGGNPKR